jgi:hypothetical protein
MSLHFSKGNDKCRGCGCGIVDTSILKTAPNKPSEEETMLLLKEALEVAEFYGDRKNWTCSSDASFHCLTIMGDASFPDEFESEVKRGGKRARALSEKLKAAGVK